MAASTNKRVLIVRFDREALPGYVNTATWLQPAGVEYLSQQGAIGTVPYGEIKLVAFVREFEHNAPGPELRQFTSRPKAAGLWLRMEFRDGGHMDGVLPNNLLLVEPAGFSVIPPDPEFQTQRVFVPRAALRQVQVLGVIGSPVARNRRKTAPPAGGQIEMFDKP